MGAGGPGTSSSSSSLLPGPGPQLPGQQRGHFWFPRPLKAGFSSCPSGPETARGRDGDEVGGQGPGPTGGLAVQKSGIGWQPQGTQGWFGREGHVGGSPGAALPRVPDRETRWQCPRGWRPHRGPRPCWPWQSLPLSPELRAKMTSVFVSESWSLTGAKLAMAFCVPSHVGTWRARCLRLARVTPVFLPGASSLGLSLPVWK